jgi:hypothetical protein
VQLDTITLPEEWSRCAGTRVRNAGNATRSSRSARRASARPTSCRGTRRTDRDAPDAEPADRRRFSIRHRRRAFRAAHASRGARAAARRPEYVPQHRAAGTPRGPGLRTGRCASCSTSRRAGTEPRVCTGRRGDAVGEQSLQARCGSRRRSAARSARRRRQFMHRTDSVTNAITRFAAL